MEIRGRTVEAVSYLASHLINVYVKQNYEDCRRKQDPSYQCFDNCENNLVMARFMEGTLISVKALVKQELSVDPKLKDITDLQGLEAAAKQPGYLLENWKKGPGKVLYLNDQAIATYNPCGFSMDPGLHDQDVVQTVRELITRKDEAYNIAVAKPLEELLKDQTIVSQLSNPVVLTMMSTMFGEEGKDLVESLRKMKEKMTH